MIDSTSNVHAPKSPKMSLKTNEEHDDLKDKTIAVLLGSAVADALGWPTEFIKTTTQLKRLHGIDAVRDFLPWEKKTGGRFNTYIDYIQPGEYSDDTQLTLSSARSLHADGSFNGHHFAKIELHHWISYARGAGATVTRAAKAATRKRTSWDSNFFTYSSKGKRTSYVNAGANGAAMRIAPVVLANIGDEPMMTQAVWANAIVTHGHPRAILGALLYAKALHLLLSENMSDQEDFIDALNDFLNWISLEDLPHSVAHWLDKWNRHAGYSFPDPFEQTKDEIRDLLFKISNKDVPLHILYEEIGCFEPNTKGSGTVTVAAAISLFLRHGGNFERAVVTAINMLGSDTDTIAAMTAGLICARKGQMAIPDKWANTMQDYGYFIRVANALHRISKREATGNDLLVDHKRVQFEEKDVVFLSSSRKVHKGLRVTHPLFGLGWVVDVNSQQIKRRGGGTMLLAKTAFDSGQSCVFRSYQPMK